MAIWLRMIGYVYSYLNRTVTVCKEGRSGKSLRLIGGEGFTFSTTKCGSINKWVNQQLDSHFVNNAITGPGRASAPPSSFLSGGVR